MDWPHAPIHRFHDAGIYFITAGTHQKQHFFRTGAALDLLQNALFAQAAHNHCSLQAWALFSNHYHLVVAADTGNHVQQMVRWFHIASAKAANERDATLGRRVWFQFRDTRLTFERSWLARLRYTHENAVHHGLVHNASHYRWCSASWFANYARPSFVKTVQSIKIDAVKVYDDYTIDDPHE